MPPWASSGRPPPRPPSSAVARFIQAPASKSTPADRATTTGTGCPSPANTTTNPGSLTTADAMVFSAAASQPASAIKTTRYRPMVGASARSRAARPSATSSWSRRIARPASLFSASNRSTAGDHLGWR